MATANATRAEPPVLCPSRHPITVGEYFRMGEAGVLEADARCELIEGEVIDLPPIEPPHASKTSRLAALFTDAVRGKAIVSIPGIRTVPDRDRSPAGPGARSARPVLRHDQRA